MRRLLVALCVLPLVAACDGLYLAPIVHTETVDDSHLPPARVNLPTVPRLDLLDTPRTWPDGTLSVAGLLLDRAELRESEVRVTGIVQEVYQCDLPAEGSAAPVDTGLAGTAAVAPTAAVTRREGCLMPHIYIVDNLRSSTRMLVADFDAFFYQPQLEVGGRYVFTARYTDRARGFTSTEFGLLAATRIEGPGIQQPEDAAAEADAGATAPRGR